MMAEVLPRDEYAEADDARWEACVAEAEDGAEPLDVYTAASLGDDQVVLEVLERDPDQALARNGLGWSPIMFAVWQGHESLVTALLETSRRRGHDACTDATVGRLPRSGRTLLMIAARFGYVGIAAALGQPQTLERRDFRGQTALFHAVRGGNEELIKMLVARGANVNACDLKGQTVLRLAERCRSPATCLFLRKAGARLEAATSNVLQQRHFPTSVDTESTICTLSLESILEGLSLHKYYALFQFHRIDLHEFLELQEDDLRRIGVSLLGPRRKMALEIERLRSLFGLGEATCGSLPHQMQPKLTK